MIEIKLFRFWKKPSLVTRADLVAAQQKMIDTEKAYKAASDNLYLNPLKEIADKNIDSRISYVEAQKAMDVAEREFFRLWSRYLRENNLNRS